MSAPRSHRFPLRVLPDRCFPALSLLPRTKAGPAREVPCRREHAHVHADLGDEDLRRALIHAGDRIQAAHLLRKRGHHLVRVGCDVLDHFVEVVEVGQHLADQKGMMGPKASGERLPQRRELSAQRAARQVGQASGSRVPRVRASSMARPETPRTSLAPDADLMPASSSTFWSRLVSRVCCSESPALKGPRAHAAGSRITRSP